MDIVKWSAKLFRLFICIDYINWI